eukprot:1499632-Rhodomonas_salina.1
MRGLLGPPLGPTSLLNPLSSPSPAPVNRRISPLATGRAASVGADEGALCAASGDEEALCDGAQDEEALWCDGWDCERTRKPASTSRICT